MTIKTQIQGRKGKTAEVTDTGALCVQTQQFNEVKKQVMDGTGVFSFFGPRSGQQFIISGIIMNAARTVTNECLITIFEANSATASSTKDIVAIDIAKSVTTPLLDINVLVTEGKWVNGTTDDPTCNVTVLGYYVSTR